MQLAAPAPHAPTPTSTHMPLSAAFSAALSSLLIYATQTTEYTY